jgi:hypothetical protein
MKRFPVGILPAMIGFNRGSSSAHVTLLARIFQQWFSDNEWLGRVGVIMVWDHSTPQKQHVTEYIAYMMITLMKQLPLSGSLMLIV